MNWEKLCPNFSFTVVKQRGNSHAMAHSHKMFKANNTVLY